MRFGMAIVAEQAPAEVDGLTPMRPFGAVRRPQRGLSRSQDAENPFKAADKRRSTRIVCLSGLAFGLRPGYYCAALDWPLRRGAGAGTE